MVFQPAQAAWAPRAMGGYAPQQQQYQQQPSKAQLSFQQPQQSAPSPHQVAASPVLPSASLSVVAADKSRAQNSNFQLGAMMM
mmetsp:Transcript_28186/g.69053  ORF Transcript_28186/g.69053 Transcript_28186/m.69053 type:complete len:83 (+) Transcript_28186:99-347(+)